MKRLLAASIVALSLAGCNEQPGSTRSLAPIPAKTVALMSEKGMRKEDPILVRLYKKEAELEVWKRTNGQYALLKSFPICRWSGQLGPKVREGDRQAPEGFYTVSPGQMNPNSSYHLSFDTGFPNAFDRSHNRTGSHLMVHGDCSSRGCYAMTDEGISEVYAIARESFSAGQRGFQFQAYPFRMTAENLARYRQDPNMPFWRNLKQGSDHFEVTKREPRISVCQGRYAFNTVADECKDDPTLAPAVAQKDEDDRKQVADLVAKGTPAVRLLYADGGQHESFKGAAPSTGGDSGSSFAILDTRPSRSFSQVSRPEALAEGPREVPIETGKSGSKSARVAVMASKSAVADPATSGSVTTPRGPGRTRLASADPDDVPTLPGAVEPGLKTSSVGADKRRQSTPGKEKASASSSSSAKVKVAPARRDKSEHAAVLLPGAQAVGPSTSGFKAN
ncbi:hypothetical protein [uncultured Enterovirga sp.]|uniref:hypothetical protein n=1 Tax=uncultured Enterovirga sp. TaxID=2026352 RepID=UPI0035CAF16E